MSSLPFICWWTSSLLPCPSYCNSAAKNVGVHVSHSILLSSVCMPSSVTAASYGHSIPSVFLRNLHNALHSGYTSLHSHQQCKTFPFFSTSSPAFTVCRIFEDGHSDQCEIIAHCGFDMQFSIRGEVEHLFRCLLAIYMSHWRNVCLGLLPTFDWVVPFYLVLSCMSCLYILEINSVSFFFCYYFIPFWGLSFHLA